MAITGAKKLRALVQDFVSTAAEQGVTAQAVVWSPLNSKPASLRWQPSYTSPKRPPCGTISTTTGAGKWPGTSAVGWQATMRSSMRSPAWS